MRDEFLGIPDAYLEFLAKVGAGSLGGRLQLYDGLIEPEDLYDPENTVGLEGVMLFADDLQGYCFGFVPGDAWRVVEIDPTTSLCRFVSVSFDEFMTLRMDKLANDVPHFPSKE